METVTSIAAAASAAIWGQPKETTDAANATTVPETRRDEEPISGVTGDTQKGEPFDMGNKEENLKSEGKEPISGVLGDTKRGESFDGSNLGSTNTEHTSKPQTTSSSGFDTNPLDTNPLNSPKSTTTSSGIPTNTIADTNIEPLSTSTSTDTPSNTNLSSSKPLISSSKPLISSKINPNLSSTEPSPLDTSTQPKDSALNLPLRPHHDTEKPGVTSLHDAHDTLDMQGGTVRASETRDSELGSGKSKSGNTGDEDLNRKVDVSGPGPRTLEDIARENGGVVSGSGSGSGSGTGSGTLGLIAPTPSKGKPSSTANIHGVKTDLKPLDQSTLSALHGGRIGEGRRAGMEKALHEERHEEEKKEEGTGRVHVKSKGLVAEGGDFDAGRAGAGREADRLLGRDGVKEKELEKDDHGSFVGSGVGEGVGGSVVGEKGTGSIGAGNSISGNGSGIGSGSEVKKSTSMSSREGVHGEREGEGDGKSGGKLSHLKEKIKEKLHKH